MHSFEARQILVWILGWPLINCVALGKLLNYSVLQAQYNERANIYNLGDDDEEDNYNNNG